MSIRSRSTSNSIMDDCAGMPLAVISGIKYAWYGCRMTGGVACKCLHDCVIPELLEEMQASCSDRSWWDGSCKNGYWRVSDYDRRFNEGAALGISVRLGRAGEKGTWCIGQKRLLWIKLGGVNELLSGLDKDGFSLGLRDLCGNIVRSY